MAPDLSTHFTADVRNIDRFASSLTVSDPRTLAFSIHGTHYLPAPASASKADTYTYTDPHDEPFQAIIFWRVRDSVAWTDTGRVIRIDCAGADSDIVQELFKPQIAQVSLAVQSEYFRDLQLNDFSHIKSASDNPPWRTLGGTYLDVHLGHDNSDLCVLHEFHRGRHTSSIRTLTQEWPIRPGHWLVAQVTLRRFQFQEPHTKGLVRRTSVIFYSMPVNNLPVEVLNLCFHIHYGSFLDDPAGFYVRMLDISKVCVDWEAISNADAFSWWHIYIDSDSDIDQILHCVAFAGEHSLRVYTELRTPSNAI
ncbi:hypothetical protein B0H17DRAFT_1207237 [Mycena rosella]|uniref:Uncharacterized protein n=1 Tax=Mycena rosella TaxID=1033263 RepID=A0AAD7G854_MYCRO|nr:hypothetical protein B0H17DRAFT_1207237 [Mycena rosella]